MICWKCKKNIDISEVHRFTECPECSASLHVCKGCIFYSPGSHFDCKEYINDVISDKEQSNFCEYFKINNKKSENSSEQSNKSQQARDAFNALFG